MLKALRKAKGIPSRPDLTRQYGQSIEQIRADHVKRYIFAAASLGQKKRVLDLACGCGYGSWLLHGSGHEVTGVDISSEAISYAERHYQGPTYLCQKAEDTKGQWDAVVSFETLEHLANPEVVLALQAPVLIASVPNEERYPFKKEKFAGDLYPHLRHYTPKEFDQLLEGHGYKIEGRFCQKDRQGDLTEGTDGRFLVYWATR